MTDIVKRARSPSPTSLQTNSKRAKEEERRTSRTMTDTDRLTKPEEVDAVDLGTTNPVEHEVEDNADQVGSDANIDAPIGEDQDADALESETPPASISMRALIVTGDASIIIGKGGKYINEIREKSGAKLTISESLPGNPERILTVAGPLDAVSKSFGLIVRRINDEPFDQPSLPGSRSVTIRFIIPNSRMGSVIGKQGTKIKEIQEASGARLTAGEQMLPGSTERVLNISGVADAVHIAVYYVGNILLERQDRLANNLAYRPTPGPSRSSGGFGPPVGGIPFGGGVPSLGSVPSSSIPHGSQTQQIFVPNDLVGCIIGRGGQKINEVRQMSGSHIKIMEPGAGVAAGGSGTERLVTITGPPANIQIAVQLLYQRLEQEKLRLSNNTPRQP